MKRLFLGLLMFSSLWAHSTEDVEKFSEAIGHLIGKNLHSLGVEIDMAALAKGLSDESLGKDSPLDEEACMEVMSILSEESLSRLAKKNLEEALLFLEQNSSKEGMISLEEGKLQYEILEKGIGASVEEYNAPLVRIKGTSLSGENLGELEEILFFDETIPGVKKGLLGMKEGEKRKLYIHPDLGYETKSPIQPNALMIFEVELIKADASSEAHAASDREESGLVTQPNAEDGALDLR